jgi:hypothetical protein
MVVGMMMVMARMMMVMGRWRVLGQCGGRRHDSDERNGENIFQHSSLLGATAASAPAPVIVTKEGH